MLIYPAIIYSIVFGNPLAYTLRCIIEYIDTGHWMMIEFIGRTIAGVLLSAFLAVPVLVLFRIVVYKIAATTWTNGAKKNLAALAYPFIITSWAFVLNGLTFPSDPRDRFVFILMLIGYSVPGILSVYWHNWLNDQNGYHHRDLLDQ